jgi:hypothetical protein
MSFFSRRVSSARFFAIEKNPPGERDDLAHLPLENDPVRREDSQSVGRLLPQECHDQGIDRGSLRKGHAQEHGKDQRLRTTNPTNR